MSNTNTPGTSGDLTLEEVARELNCDRSHVWRLRFELRAFNIAAPPKPGKKARAAWRVSREALEAFRKGRELAPTP